MSVRSRPLLPNPRHPCLHPPVPAHQPVGKHAHRLLPLEQVGTPPDHKGAGEGDAEVGLHPPGLHGQVPHGRKMPLPPVGPARHHLVPRTLRLPGGQGDPGQRGVQVAGAQVLAPRHGDHHRGGGGFPAKCEVMGFCRKSATSKKRGGGTPFARN